MSRPPPPPKGGGVDPFPSAATIAGEVTQVFGEFASIACLLRLKR